MVRTIKQTTVREEKIRMSPKEAREMALLCNAVEEGLMLHQVRR